MKVKNWKFHLTLTLAVGLSDDNSLWSIGRKILLEIAEIAVSTHIFGIILILILIPIIKIKIFEILILCLEKN